MLAPVLMEPLTVGAEFRDSLSAAEGFSDFLNPAANPVFDNRIDAGEFGYMHEDGFICTANNFHFTGSVICGKNFPSHIDNK